MPKSILVHGLWALVATATFVLGSQFFPSKKSGKADSEAARLSHSKSNASREGRSSAPDGTKLSATPSGSQTGLEKLLKRHQVVLSDDDIAALGNSFRSASSPIERRLVYSRLLEGLTVENALLIREQIVHLPEHSPEFREFHYAWGALGGEDAVLNGKDTPKRDMAATFAGWASANPTAALAWYQGLPEEGFDRNGLKWGGVYGLADNDPNLALQFVSSLRESGDKDSERMMHVVTGAVLRNGDPAAAAQWADGLGSEDLRVFARQRVASDFVKKDAEAAAEWAAQYNDQPEGSRLINHVSRDWAQRDPAAAVTWLESLGSSEGRIEGYGSAFGAWAGRDPEAAGNYLNEMPRSPERDSALSGFANRVMQEDPATAISWANAIADQGRREETLIRTARHYFQRDHKAAVEWLPNSGLSPEALQRLRARK